MIRKARFAIILLMVVMAPNPTSLVQAITGVLFQDDFSSGNASQWTPSGPGIWSVQSAEYVVSMGGVQNQFGVTSAGDSQWTDYIVEFDMKGEAGVDKVFEVRFDDTTHAGYWFDLRSNLNYLFNDVLLIEMYYDPSQPNWGKIIQDVSYPNTTNTWYHITVMAIGPSISLFLNQQPVLSHTFDAAYIAQGKIAFWGWNGSITNNIVHFDNVKVYTPAMLYLPILVR